MDYKTNIEFLDWLMWDKRVSQKDWLESSVYTRDTLFKEFKESRRKDRSNKKD